MKNELITKMYEGQQVIFRNNEVTNQPEVRINEVAKFCGWINISKGKEYVNWKRVNEHLKILGCAEVHNGDFIPEFIMYPLIGKASNERATQFMLWVGKVLVEIRQHGGYISPTAKPEQVVYINKAWAKKSIYLTEEIHDRKSIRKYIREYDKMKLDECIDKIINIVEPMKGAIKHELLDVAIKELKAIDANLIKDTIKNTFIKDTAIQGVVILQDVKLGKYKVRIQNLEQIL
jgi:prophage antirepressor-like protein